MSPVMWPRMRDDYEPGSANPGQSLVKSSSQDAWEPGAEPGGGGGGDLDATGQPSGHVPTAQGDDTWEWAAQTGGGAAIQVGGEQPASGWWLDTTDAPPEPDIPVTPTPPTFTDASGTANDSYTIPTQTGVVYRVGGVVTAAGTYPGSGSVTIDAVAAPGYVIEGVASWSHTFDTGVTPAITDTFDTPAPSTQYDLAGRTTTTGNRTWAIDDAMRGDVATTSSLRMLNDELFTTNANRACYVTASQQHVRAELFYHTRGNGTLRLCIAAAPSTGSNFRGIGIAVNHSAGAYCFAGTGGTHFTVGAADGRILSSAVIAVEWDGTTVRGWHDGNLICEEPLAPSAEFGNAIAISHLDTTPSWFMDNFKVYYL